MLFDENITELHFNDLKGARCSFHRGQSPAVRYRPLMTRRAAWVASHRPLGFAWGPYVFEFIRDSFYKYGVSEEDFDFRTLNIYVGDSIKKIKKRLATEAGWLYFEYGTDADGLSYWTQPQNQGSPSQDILSSNDLVQVPLDSEDINAVQSRYLKNENNNNNNNNNNKEELRWRARTKKHQRYT